MGQSRIAPIELMKQAALKRDTFDEPLFNSRFLNDALDLLSGRVSGHMNSYAFDDPDPCLSHDNVQGGFYWKRFLKNSADYYVIREEEEAIRRSAKTCFSSIPDGMNVVELGPGELQAVQNKTIEFLKAYPSTGYTAIDINHDFARAASDKVRDSLRIHSEAIEGDFFHDNLLQAGSGSNVFILFGGLLCNFGQVNGYPATQGLKLSFNKLRTNIKTGDFLVIAQDANNNAHKLKKAYTHEDLGKYILSVLHRIKRNLPTEGFDPGAFEFMSDWDSNQRVMRLGARVSRPLSFKINGTAFTLHEGQILWLVNSYKLSKETFLDCAKSSGFKAISTHTEPCSNMHIHVLKA